MLNTRVQFHIPEKYFRLFTPTYLLWLTHPAKPRRIVMYILHNIKAVDLRLRSQVLKCRKRIHAHDAGEHGRQIAPMPQHPRQTRA